MTIGFMVSWFCTLNLKVIGFLVSWFHGFVHSISGQQEADRFRGFVFSSTPSLGYRNDDRFHVFVFSWFHGLSTPSLVFITMSQRWSEQNHETTNPWNLYSFRIPRDGMGETTKPVMKPQNHVDRFLGFIECTVRYAMKPWNHEITGLSKNLSS